MVAQIRQEIGLIDLQFSADIQEVAHNWKEARGIFGKDQDFELLMHLVGKDLMGEWIIFQQLLQLIQKKDFDGQIQCILL